ncbi:MAG: hypothetical protein WC700_19855, partial [Gemmatimonadaceae bacterium]
WENAHAELWENAHAELRGNAHAVLRGNAHARSFDNAIVRALSAAVLIVAFHYSTVVCQDCKPKIEKHGSCVTIVRTKQMMHTVKTFCDTVTMRKGKVVLYKSVRPDTRCDFYTGRIKYEGVVDCPDWDANPEIECGNGLPLSPTPGMALSYNRGLVLECEVSPKDIAVYAPNVTKVRCRRVNVIGEYKGESA